MFEYQKKRIKQIDDAGMYDAKIIRANLNKEKTAVCLNLLLDDIYTESTWIVLKTKQGLENDYGITLLNELLDHLDITKLHSENNKLKQLENKAIGVLLSISENEGYRNINLLGLYDLTTHQTAYEKSNNSDAKQIYKKCDELEANNESN